MDWILHNARLKDNHPLVDIGITNGKIVALEASGSENGLFQAKESWDVQGRVLLPGLVDAHTHLDKTYTTLENKSGTLQEAIEVVIDAQRVLDAVVSPPARLATFKAGRLVVRTKVERVWYGG